MVEEFTIQYKPQREWGWLAILDFFLAGSGAGLFLIGMVLGIDLALLVGLVTAAAGALALLADLGRPERFWRAISRPATSWISRGAILVSLFLVFGILTVAIPSTVGGARLITGIIAAIAALGVMAYTGFLLADSRGVPAWHSALVPVQFVIFSLLAGCGALYLLLSVLNNSNINLTSLELVGLVLGLGTLLMLLSYLLALGSLSPAARRAQQELVRGDLSLVFLGGGVLLGVIIPTAIIAYLFFAGSALAQAGLAHAISGILLLIGGLLIRYSLLKVGFYQPVVERL